MKQKQKKQEISAFEIITNNKEFSHIHADPKSLSLAIKLLLVEEERKRKAHQ